MSTALQVRTIEPPIQWDYDKSVAKMRPLIVKWRNMTVEMLEELWVARAELDSRGKNKGKENVPNGTFSQYLEDIGLPRRTAHHWLSRYDHENQKMLEAPEKGVHFLSQSDEWNTPQEVIDKVLNFFGHIDCDPCSNDSKNPNVPAGILYTEVDDGLSQKWYGKVYMNPPYGDAIIGWVEKLVDEYENGEVSEAVALLPARTDTQWFHLLRRYPRCFIIGRLKFGGQENSAPFPSVFIYLGKNTDGFFKNFKTEGDCYNGCID